jgi:hypothetical protein
MRHLAASVLLGLLTSVLAFPALTSRAQEAITAGEPVDDWEFAADLAGRSQIATVGFSGGLSLDVTCYEEPGIFLVALSGLPVEVGDVYVATALREDGRALEGRLTAGASGQLRAEPSPRFARFLRGGGELSLRAVADGGPPIRLAVALPEEHANLDRTIQACGVSLDDARDVLPVLTDLLEIPSPSVVPPRRTGTRAAGYWTRVELSCVVTADTRLSACLVESERPTGTGYGEIVARAYEGYPIKVSDPVGATGRVLFIVVTGAPSRR